MDWARYLLWCVCTFAWLGCAAPRPDEGRPSGSAVRLPPTDGSSSTQPASHAVATAAAASEDPARALFLDGPTLPAPGAGPPEPTRLELSATPEPGSVGPLTTLPESDPLEEAPSYAPRSTSPLPTEYWDLTLPELVRLAFEHSPIVREAGGRVLMMPNAVASTFDPGITNNDPLFGTAAALSAFDSSLSSKLFYRRGDRALNNFTLGGGVQELKQDLVTYDAELARTTMQGTRWAVRNYTGHDRNNRTSNLFGSAWDTNWEAEVRQPLLQGAGWNFNSIAGPNSRPGLQFSNGVRLARISRDISQYELEAAVQDFAADLEETYWNLALAYADYELRLRALDSAEAIWRQVRARANQQLSGGEADKESQARAQYYYYQDLVYEALQGSDRGGGIYAVERRLRRLAGLPINGGDLIRPTDDAEGAPVEFDWLALQDVAVRRRSELRQQQLKVRQFELRAVAARNFMLPRLDMLARYRMMGFGDDLAGGGPRFSSAYQDWASLDHQEWDFGMEFNAPIGYRLAHSSLRQAELQLARERALWQDQREQVILEVSNALARCRQVQASLDATRQRRAAADDRWRASQAAYAADRMPLDMLLEAQEQRYEAERRYRGLLTQYRIELKNVNRAAGLLLGDLGVDVTASE